MTILVTLAPSSSWQFNEATWEANLDGNLHESQWLLTHIPKQSLGLMSARYVSVHEVDVRLSLDKRVPFGRVQKILQRLRTAYLGWLLPDKWNIVIDEVRHEQHLFSMSTNKRVDAHMRDVRDADFLVVLWCRNRNDGAKWICRAWSQIVYVKHWM
jgi:hypothetical protein